MRNWPALVWALAVGIAITSAIYALRRTRWVRAWNTDPAHHAGIAAFCLFTSAVTVCAAVLTWNYWSAAEALESELNGTRDEVLADSTRGFGDGGWRRATFVQIAEEVRQRGMEDFKDRTPPAEGGQEMPVTTSDTARFVAERYVQAVEANLSAGGFGLLYPRWQRAFIASDASPVDVGNPGPPASGAMSADYVRAPFVRTAVEGRLEQQAAALRAAVASVTRTSGLLLWLPALLLELTAFALTARAAVREMRLDF